MAGRNLGGQARLIQADPLPWRHVDFAAQALLDLQPAQAVRKSLFALKIRADPSDLGSNATDDLASILPVFNTYGPRMHPNDRRVVSNFIVQALLNRNITAYGDPPPPPIESSRRESRQTDNHEPFFDSIDPKRTSRRSVDERIWLCPLLQCLAIGNDDLTAAAGHAVIGQAC